MSSQGLTIFMFKALCWNIRGLHGHDLCHLPSGGSLLSLGIQDVQATIWAINGGRLDSSQSYPHSIQPYYYNDETTRLVATLPTLRDRFFGLLHPHKRVRIHRHKKSMWVSHADTVSGLSLSPDRLLLYSISWDRTIKVWRTSDFKCVKSIEGAHDDAINAIVVSKDGTVYTGSADAKIKVWKKNALVGVNALALGLDGNVLYSGGGDGSIFVWEISCLDQAGVVGRLKGHAKAVMQFDFHVVQFDTD
ncbi:hypothetical protein QJS10_CPB15g01780 [Acorus calamus]|uniref:Uncharacterized protein n=1 Tax=Acorus calamus TaxID=4465 RepID=A0AAV9D4A5_ACOCL|nr:hypothetical protein QJS10_CPB15g01780 [Acorus calamus]